MQQAPFLSVIIPVYNAERFLRSSVQSLLKQGISEMEIILVDDCSTDGSLPLCQELAREDERILCLSLERNAGVSGARNAGIARAQGEYLTFMDADDALEPGAYSHIVRAVQEHEFPDVVVFGAKEIFFLQDGTVQREKEVTVPASWYEDVQAVRQAVLPLEQSTLYGYVWNKWYKRSLLAEHRAQFDLRYAINEDFLFNADVFEHVNSLVILDKPYYRYAKRPKASATGQFIPEYYQVHILRVGRLAEQFARWGVLDARARDVLAGLYTRYTFSALARNCDRRAGMRHGQRVQFIKEVFASELYRQLIPGAHSENRVVAGMEWIMRRRMAAVALCVARALFFMQNKLPTLFSKASDNK